MDKYTYTHIYNDIFDDLQMQFFFIRILFILQKVSFDKNQQNNLIINASAMEINELIKCLTKSNYLLIPVI